MVIISFLSAASGSPQALKEGKEHRRTIDDVSLTLVSQRKLPETPPRDETRKGSDVFVVGPGDDLVVRFRLTNCSNANVYYLKSIYDKGPTGYVLFKQAAKEGWKATSPDWGRRGSKMLGMKIHYIP